ncbi:MAG: hypothetical protein R3C59_29430 [Planctomycetaceae bacterium]
MKLTAAAALASRANRLRAEPLLARCGDMTFTATTRSSRSIMGFQNNPAFPWKPTTPLTS